jgi:hypothetical protein
MDGQQCSTVPYTTFCGRYSTGYNPTDTPPGRHKKKAFDFDCDGVVEDLMSTL